MWCNGVTIFTPGHILCAHVTLICKMHTHKKDIHSVYSTIPRKTPVQSTHTTVHTWAPMYTCNTLAPNTHICTCTHMNLFLTVTIKISICSFILRFYFDEKKSNSRGEKNLFIRKFSGKNSQDIVMYYWLVLVVKRIIWKQRRLSRL